MYDSKLDKYDIMVAIGAQLKTLDEIQETLAFLDPAPGIVEIFRVVSGMCGRGELFVADDDCYGVTALRPQDAVVYGRR
jgi:hypothetical protein